MPDKYSYREMVRGYVLKADGSPGDKLPKEVMALVLVTIDQVKGELRDIELLNEITRQELTDEEYVDCIADAFDTFNVAPPFESYWGPADIPDRALLVDMAACEALKRLIRWHARNQFSASDAGLQIPIHEQWQPLRAILREDQADCDARLKALKGRLNIARGWGAGIGSPLGFGGPWA